jgi:hypothetical protein
MVGCMFECPGSGLDGDIATLKSWGWKSRFECGVVVLGSVGDPVVLVPWW